MIMIARTTSIISSYSTSHKTSHTSPLYLDLTDGLWDVCSGNLIEKMAALCRSILARPIGIDYIMTTELLQCSVSPINRCWPGALAGIILVLCTMSYLAWQEASSLYYDHVDSIYTTLSNTSSGIRIFRGSGAVIIKNHEPKMDYYTGGKCQLLSVQHSDYP